MTDKGDGEDQERVSMLVLPLGTSQKPTELHC